VRHTDQRKCVCVDRKYLDVQRGRYGKEEYGTDAGIFAPDFLLRCSGKNCMMLGFDCGSADG
jgi:hypothetical protein